ncbi:MAG: glycosyl hydrolase, partial [Tannerellaceae bacterium]
MRKKFCVTISALLLSGMVMMGQAADYPFRNANLPTEQRIADLIGRLTIEEKVELMKHASPGVERLGVPAYNWWNEALHGVARTKEKVTVFPQAIGMAATFDAPALQK